MYLCPCQKAVRLSGSTGSRRFGGAWKRLKRERENVVNVNAARRNIGQSCLYRSTESQPSSGWIKEPTAGTSSVDLEKVFVTKEVQNLLKELTGLSLQKVFGDTKPQPKAERPYYRLATDQELAMLQQQAKDEAKLRLQIPPFLNPDLSEPATISYDPEIAGLETVNLVFTDISAGMKERERTVVVREPNGLLREATKAERDRMMRTYFPLKKREVYHPAIFFDDQLIDALNRGEHVHVLDYAAYQFEPDDVEFVRVSKAVFDDVVKKNDYEALHSSRHFGSFVFYLVLNKNIDGLCLHCLENRRIEDVGALVRLFCIVHPLCGIEVRDDSDPIELAKQYISHCSKDGGSLERTLQNIQKEWSSPKTREH